MENDEIILLVVGVVIFLIIILVIFIKLRNRSMIVPTSASYIPVPKYSQRNVNNELLNVSWIMWITDYLETIRENTMLSSLPENNNIIINYFKTKYNNMVLGIEYPPCYVLKHMTKNDFMTKIDLRRRTIAVLNVSTGISPEILGTFKTEILLAILRIDCNLQIDNQTFVNILNTNPANWTLQNRNNAIQLIMSTLSMSTLSEESSNRDLYYTINIIYNLANRT